MARLCTYQQKELALMGMPTLAETAYNAAERLRLAHRPLEALRQYDLALDHLFPLGFDRHGGRISRQHYLSKLYIQIQHMRGLTAGLLRRDQEAERNLNAARDCLTPFSDQNLPEEDEQKLEYHRIGRDLATVYARSGHTDQALTMVSEAIVWFAAHKLYADHGAALAQRGRILCEEGRKQGNAVTMMEGLKDLKLADRILTHAGNPNFELFNLLYLLDMTRRIKTDRALPGWYRERLHKLLQRPGVGAPVHRLRFRLQLLRLPVPVIRAVTSAFTRLPQSIAERFARLFPGFFMTPR